jgi:hypothetical protein
MVILIQVRVTGGIRFPVSFRFDGCGYRCNFAFVSCTPTYIDGFKHGFSFASVVTQQVLKKAQ